MQPSLDGGDEVRYLLWGFKALDPDYKDGLPRKLVLAAQRAFHSTFVDDMEKDPTCRELAGLLAGNGNIGLIELGQKRSFAQPRTEELAINSPDERIRAATLEKDLKKAEQLLAHVTA